MTKLQQWRLDSSSSCELNAEIEDEVNGQKRNNPKHQIKVAAVCFLGRLDNVGSIGVGRPGRAAAGFCPSFFSRAPARARAPNL